MSGRRREEGDGKANFSFDRVFPPQTSQAEVFEEISQLIQVRVSMFYVLSIFYVLYALMHESNWRGGIFRDFPAYH